MNLYACSLELHAAGAMEAICTRCLMKRDYSLTGQVMMGEAQRCSIRRAKLLTAHRNPISSSPAAKTRQPFKWSCSDAWV